jgi:hypothetical protein
MRALWKDGVYEYDVRCIVFWFIGSLFFFFYYYVSAVIAITISKNVVSLLAEGALPTEEADPTLVGGT